MAFDCYSEWSPAVAEEVAREEGIALTADHWRVIACWRELSARGGRVPWLDDLASRCGLPVSKLSELFPDRPREILSRLAGLPE